MTLNGSIRFFVVATFVVLGCGGGDVLEQPRDATPPVVVPEDAAPPSATSDATPAQAPEAGITKACGSLGNGGRLNDVTFTPDGTSVIARFSGGMVAAYDMRGTRQAAWLEAQSNRGALFFTSDGALVVSAEAGHQADIVMRDVRSGLERSRTTIGSGEGLWLNDVAPDGRQVLVENSDTSKLVDLSKPGADFALPKGQAFFLEQGTEVAVNNPATGKLLIFNSATHAQTTVTTALGYISALTADRTRAAVRVAAAGLKYETAVVEVRSGKVVFRFPKAPLHATFSPDGQRLALKVEGGEMWLADLTKGSPLRPLVAQADGGTWNQDGSVFAIAAPDGLGFDLLSLKNDSWTHVRFADPWSTTIDRFAVSPNGGFLVTDESTTSGSLQRRLWNAITMAPLAELDTSDTIFAVADDGLSIVTLRGDAQLVRVRLSDGAQLQSGVFGKHLTVAPNGREAAALSGDVITIVSLPSLDVLGTVEVKPDSKSSIVRALALASGGQRLLVLRDSFDLPPPTTSLTAIDVRKKQVLWEKRPNVPMAVGLVFSANGTRLILSSPLDSTLMDSDTGMILKTLDPGEPDPQFPFAQLPRRVFVDNDRALVELRILPAKGSLILTQLSAGSTRTTLLGGMGVDQPAYRPAEGRLFVRADEAIRVFCGL